MREGVNALFYLTRSGGACCRMISRASRTDYYRHWRLNGPWQRMHDALRLQVRDASIPQQAGRDPEPSAAILDSLRVKTTERDRGSDAGKKVKGRKRHLLVGSVAEVLVG
jgi:putative transposase